MAAADRHRAFWERHAAHYDRITTGLLGKPLPRAIELTANAAAGADAVLEVAAGTGLFTAAVAPRVGHVVATDYAESMLGLVRDRLRRHGIANVETSQRDLYALGYPAASFDVVIAANVLHLVPDLPAALEELTRVLKAGGKLITPTFAHDQTATSRLVSRALGLVAGSFMHRRLTTETLRAAQQRQGLLVTAVETIPGIIPIAYVEGIRRD